MKITNSGAFTRLTPDNCSPSYNSPDRRPPDCGASDCNPPDCSTPVCRRPRIKICGLTRTEDIDAVNESHPDFAGFVFAPRSRRYITREWASVLRARLNGCIGVVGVFCDAGLDEIADLVKDGIIDMVQLHGNEDAAYVKSLRELLSGTACAPIIKAVSADFLHSHIPSGGCCSHDCIPSGGFGGPDYFLIDNGGGGTGRAFDWGILHGLHRDDKLYLDLGCAPFFLAGGIDEDNIAEALAVAPYAVDVSSGAETNGVKDARMIARLVEAVRKANYVPCRAKRR